MKIVADEHIPFVADYFADWGDLILKSGRSISSADVSDADMLLVRSITAVDKVLLKNSNIKFVGTITTGLDHIDEANLKKNNITLATAAGFNAPPVADYAVSVIAALERRRVLPVSGGKAAVIGVGRVGRLVAECLRLLSYQVVLCDPLRAENEADFESIALEDISDVDLVTLHVPLTKEGKYPTHHMIDECFLKRQKPGAVLVNASRGGVINSDALLNHGKHLVWCLDVWENEPHIDKRVLAQTLIATPHIAGYSVQGKMRGVEMIYQLACQHFHKTPVITAKTKLPTQTLSFAGEHHHWQDIVLGVFNPVILTAMMRTTLLDVDEHGVLFDEMRKQFNYRNEFAFTTIKNIQLPDNEVRILAKLGMTLV